MHDAADRRKRLVKQAVRRGVGRGLFGPFDHFAGFNADHHHVVGGHDAVIHARRFDDEHALLAIDSADVTPGKRHQVVFWQGQVGFKYLAFEIF